MENRNEEAAMPSRLKRSISDSELAQPSSRNGNNGLEHYEDTNLVCFNISLSRFCGAENLY